MNDEQDLKKVLLQARKQFQSSNYDLAKEKLQIFKEPNIAVENNLLIIEHLVNRDNTDVVLNSLMKILTQEDIKLYTKSCNGKNQVREPIHIDHEYLYWNIIIIALKLGKLKTATLVANQASFLCGGFYQKTSLYILSALLHAQLQDNKTASCMGCFDKYWKIGSSYHKYQQQCKVYSIMCSISFIRFLLKLGLLEQAKNQYMLKLGVSQQQLFESIAQKKVQNGLQDTYSTIIKQAMLPLQIHQQFLHSQIQFYHKKNHNSIKILSDMLLDIQTKSNRAQRIQILANHNIALNYCINGKTTIAKKLLFQTIEKLRIMNQKDAEDNERLILYQYAKENLIYAYLQNCTSYQEAYVYISKLGVSQSYKLNYRKAQVCINFYHELLQKYSRLVPWEDIHDQYDTVFYYPNEPYIGQKSKNRNIHYANKKHFYRRYVLSSWEDHFSENGKKQERQIQAHEQQKQILSLKIKAILQQAQQFLKQALILLSAQQDIKASLTLEHLMSQRINQSIHTDHIKFKKSILVILCYLSLCQCDWIRCIRYGKQFEKLNYDKSNQYYHVLSYMVEAYCEMGKFTQAYETTHIIYSNGVNQQTPIKVRDSMNLTGAFFEDSNELILFLFNMAVLHSRDNRIPESHQAIHKLMNQMQILHNSYQANMPLSLVDLLIHYNLKTQNYSSALQMIKRKRILTLPNVNGNRSLLKVTK